jgi:hypothetical protein
VPVRLVLAALYDIASLKKKRTAERVRYVTVCYRHVHNPAALFALLGQKASAMVVTGNSGEGLRAPSSNARPILHVAAWVRRGKSTGGYPIILTLDACFPFGPSVMSNSTFWPSVSDL